MTEYKLISLLVPLDEADQVEKAIPTGTLCMSEIVERSEFGLRDEMRLRGAAIMFAFARALDLQDKE